MGLLTYTMSYDEEFRLLSVTSPLVDRIAHKAHILDLSRATSYRCEETTTWRRKKVAHV